MLHRAYYLAHFAALLCIIFAGSVPQEFMLVSKGDSCALGDLPKSTLLLA